MTMKAHEQNSYRKPRTVEELTEQNVKLVAQLDAQEQEKRTPTDRAVEAITTFCGRITFVWVHVLWFGLWIAVNVLPGLPKRWRFDPYPFPTMLMIVNLEAIFLTVFILISQNRQSKLAERRNHLDLQINLLSEQENTKILVMLDAIHRHLGIPEADPDVKIMLEATEPDRLITQIKEVIEKE